jgi:hypothetical protein
MVSFTFFFPGNTRDGSLPGASTVNPKKKKKKKKNPEKQLCLAGNKTLLEGVSASTETDGPIGMSVL